MVKTIGAAMIAGYFGLFYFLPIVLLGFFGPHEYLLYDGDVLACGLVVGAVLGITYLLAFTDIRLPTRWAGSLPNVFESRLIVLGLAIATLPLAIAFQQNFGISFRYTGGGVAQGGFLPQYVYLYRAFYYSFILYHFLCFVSKGTISRRARFGILCHTVNWALCVVGSADMIWIGMALLMSVLGPRAHRIVVHETAGQTHVLKSALKQLAIGVLIVVVAGALIFFGFANKSGVADTVDRFLGDGIVFVLSYLYYRISVFVASLEHVLSYGFADLSFYSRSIEVLLDMISYRIEVILGLGASAPDIQGLNHLNYFEIYAAPANMRSGASPGPIGSFLYLPIMPLNLVACSLYLAALFNSLNRAAPLKRGHSPTFFTMLFLIIVGFVLLHSPIEAFVKVGPELFMTIFLLYALEKAKVSNERAVLVSARSISAEVGGLEHGLR